MHNINRGFLAKVITNSYLPFDYVSGVCFEDNRRSAAKMKICRVKTETITLEN